MALTEAQLQQFATTGFVAVPQFFGPAEVAAMQAEVRRFEREGLLNNVTTDGDGKTPAQAAKNLQLCPMADKSPLFRALPFDAKVVEAVGQLIGEPFLLHLDQIFLKPGGDGMGTSWHQDNAYFRIADPMKGTAMWVAVHAATIANGTMHVIPGSFRQEYPHSRDPYSNHHIRCYPPELEEQAIELPAGGVLFFCYGTAHCTKRNSTSTARAGAAFHFLRLEWAQEKGLVQEDRQCRPVLAGAQASGGRQEYGQVVAGTWPVEVAKALQEA